MIGQNTSDIINLAFMWSEIIIIKFVYKMGTLQYISYLF